MWARFLFSMKDRRELAHSNVDGEVAGIAAFEGASAVSLKDGSLFFLLADGRRVAAPRPISETGRRFLGRSFRETGPFTYGEVLAINDRYLATATLTGHLALLNRSSPSIRDSHILCSFRLNWTPFVGPRDVGFKV